MEDLIAKVNEPVESLPSVNEPNIKSLPSVTEPVSGVEKATARKRTTRTETKAFMTWYLSEDVQQRCKNYTNGKIGQEYLEKTGIDIKPACIAYNKNLWVIHNGDLIKKSYLNKIE